MHFLLAHFNSFFNSFSSSSINAKQKFWGLSHLLMCVIFWTSNYPPRQDNQKLRKNISQYKIKDMENQWTWSWNKAREVGIKPARPRGGLRIYRFIKKQFFLIKFNGFPLQTIAMKSSIFSCGRVPEASSDF